MDNQTIRKKGNNVIFIARPCDLPTYRHVINIFIYYQTGQLQIVQTNDAISSNFQGEAYGEQIRDFGNV